MPKFLKILSYFLLITSFLLGIIFYIVPEEVKKDLMTNVLLYFAYILFLAALIAAIAFPLMNVLSNPKGLKKGLISIGVVVVVFGLAFLMSSGKPIDAVVNPAPSVMTLKITDTGLIVTYILAAVSILAIVGGGIINMVRNR
jgi:hypothetical protein